MKIGIISIERDNVVNDIIESCKKLNVDYKLVNPENIAIGINMDFNIKYFKSSLLNIPIYFVRNLGYDNIFNFDILRYLENFSDIVNPPKGIEFAGNKFLTSMMLEKYNLPQPKTVVTSSISEAIYWIDCFEDVVIKPLIGCRGEGIIRIKKDMTITNKLEKLNKFKEKYKTFYIQEFIQPISNEYKDIRAFVIDDEVFAYYRIGGDNWKNNVSCGAKIEMCRINDELEDLAIKAKEALNLFYAGVDVIESKDGYKVLEVNATPSWEGLKKLNINISDILVKKMIRFSKC
ncbi:30S ribosomal protein S6 modification protein RimK [Methanocaldococcus villosus KIN24-T80]|uniref:30S ribosomal protein S6 modification protein RimK n=1 Tax=Methanocaldococcus villosus KIN24-T80 TaxID=1069083 RepID=N6UTY6_9EURY|nr:tetrahydromethanopterin:alpha-L-glutamate ligase [Methanocaldococcus villosus]ENN95814.1 30S ribosomal protein S6 modification protein RimK [Methanocaldococcus villosus KIN24-T80]